MIEVSCIILKKVALYPQLPRLKALLEYSFEMTIFGSYLQQEANIWMSNVGGSIQFNFYYIECMSIGNRACERTPVLLQDVFWTMRSKLFPLAVELVRRLFDDREDGVGIGGFGQFVGLGIGPVPDVGNIPP